MNTEKIYLRAIRDGDRFRVVDQNGREVARIQGVTVDVDIEGIVQLTIRCADHDKNNDPHVGNR